MNIKQNEDWSLIISPKRGLFNLNIRELIRYRDLIVLFIKRDFIVQYKQTILGPLWYLINPIISTVMYTFVFGRLANIGTDGIPHTLFYYSGTMLWTYFTGCFSSNSHLFITNANIFGKVYFPRLVIPINYAAINSIKMLIQFLLLMAFIIYFNVNGADIKPSWTFALFPLLMIWLATIGTGSGIIISSLTTKYRDLNHLVSFALGLAMYATPVVYPLSEIPVQFQWIAYVNPVCAPIELFRQWFFGFSSINSSMIISSLGITFLLVFFGLILFNQNETTFVDVI